MNYHLFRKIDSWKFNRLFLIGIAILFKVIYFIINFYIHDAHSSHVYTLFGDDKQYIDYCENIFLKGDYFVLVDNLPDYAFRMPGTAFLYVPIRLFVNQELTLSIFVVIQTVLSGVATYVLALLGQKIFKRRIIFYAIFMITCLCSYITSYNNGLMTESLGLSVMIFAFYYFYQALETGKSSLFLLSGFFMTWLIFLRPFMVIVFLVAVTVLCWYVLIKKATIKNVLLLVTSFIIIDGTWTVRNYYKTEKIIPFQTSVSWVEKGSKSLKSKIEFIQAFGFKYENWRTDSQCTWFNNKMEMTSVKIPDNSIFPERTFNGGLTIDSLILARKNMHISFDKKADGIERIKADQEAVRILGKFIQELKLNRLFDYYIGNRVRLTKSFLAENTTRMLRTAPYPLNVSLVFWESYINYFIKILGITGLFLILFIHRYNLKMLFFTVFTPVFIIVLFPIYMGVDESRFIIMTFPFFILLAGYVLMRVSDFKKYKLPILFVMALIPFILALNNTKELLY